MEIDSPKMRLQNQELTALEKCSAAEPLIVLVAKLVRNMYPSSDSIHANLRDNLKGMKRNIGKEKQQKTVGLYEVTNTSLCE